jgi:uncharacterized BrkB/YihY/UPF0761 family membrane protein
MINYKKYKPSHLLLILTFIILFANIGGIILKYLFFEFGILPMYDPIFGNLPYTLPILFLGSIYFYLVARDKKWTPIQSVLFATFCFICGTAGVIIATYFNQ